MRCTCCERERDDVVGLRGHDDVKICRSCIGWLHSRAAIVASTPILPVGDMDKAVAFYETAGFAVRAYDGGGYAFVSYDDRSVFDLTLVAADTLCSSTCYLTVPEVDGWHERLARAGLEPGSLEDKPWGMREFTLVDPSGNRLRVGQPAGPVAR